jgi:hypothetical protein
LHTQQSGVAGPAWDLGRTPAEPGDDSRASDPTIIADAITILFLSVP